MNIRRLAAGFVLVAASFTTAFTAGTIGAPPAFASVAASSHTRLWWDGTTCRQWAAWERKPSAERFRHLAADAGHADTYLRVDVALLADDVRDHAAAYTLHLDNSFVAMDCTYTPDRRLARQETRSQRGRRAATMAPKAYDFYMTVTSTDGTVSKGACTEAQALPVPGDRRAARLLRGGLAGRRGQHQAPGSRDGRRQPRQA